MSVDLESVTSKLDWKDFECFVSTIFESAGYEVHRNQRFTKPKMEIDLVASRGRIAFAVDCKHWKRTVGYVTMLGIGTRQIERSLRLLESHERVIPVVLTWHDEMFRILENGVPIVPIHRLEDFLLNWESSEGDILVLDRSLS